ncbi:MAG: hypothetical protein DIU69_04615 [Bacillota bacterium]|nr:MAG: hypothetical protein DIU69_04615 [Bacillota bacterium]
MIPDSVLFEEARRLNVCLQWIQWPPGAKCRGFALYDPLWERWVILIDRELEVQRRLFRCVLAEELGHVATGHVVPVGMARWWVMRARAEERAFRWAANLLMPPQEVGRILQCFGADLTAVADAFDVTEDFANRALALYRVAAVARTRIYGREA